MSVPAPSWLKPLSDWPQALSRALQGAPVAVRIVLAAVRGSAPREPGVGMLVSPAAVVGTIGGGQLEWQALTMARAMLDDAAVPARLQRMVLAADLGQCCGGVVEVWLERYTRADVKLLDAAAVAARRGPAVLESTLSSTGIERRVVCAAGTDAETSQLLRTPRAQAAPRVDRGRPDEVTLRERLDDALPPLWLYGAGHVGQALARILMELPVRLTWVDSRAELLPAQNDAAVQIVHSEDPVATLSDAPPGARFLVLTHSHPLDYALCRAILQRGDFAWAGLIGSSSKAARFRARLARDGLEPKAIAALVCPIGIDGISSKWPAAIAVGVAAQLMRDISAGAAGRQHAPATPEAEATCAGVACANCGAGAAPSAGAQSASAQSAGAPSGVAAPAGAASGARGAPPW
jgi:xanthine dehydrogenase accessory factor